MDPSQSVESQLSEMQSQLQAFRAQYRKGTSIFEEPGKNRKALLDLHSRVIECMTRALTLYPAISPLLPLPKLPAVFGRLHALDLQLETVAVETKRMCDHFQRSHYNSAIALFEKTVQEWEVPPQMGEERVLKLDELFDTKLTTISQLREILKRPAERAFAFKNEMFFSLVLDLILGRATSNQKGNFLKRIKNEWPEWECAKEDQEASDNLLKSAIEFNKTLQLKLDSLFEKPFDSPETIEAEAKRYQELALQLKNRVRLLFQRPAYNPRELFRLLMFIEDEIEPKRRHYVLITSSQNRPLIESIQWLFEAIREPPADNDEAFMRVKGIYFALTTLKQLKSRQDLSEKAFRLLETVSFLPGKISSHIAKLPRENLWNTILDGKKLPKNAVPFTYVVEEILLALFYPAEFKNRHLFDLVFFNLRSCDFYANDFEKRLDSDPLFAAAIGDYLTTYGELQQTEGAHFSIIFSNLQLCLEEPHHFETPRYYGESAFLIKMYNEQEERSPFVEAMLPVVEARRKKVNEIVKFPPLKDPSVLLSGDLTDIFAALCYCFWSEEYRSTYSQLLKYYFASIDEDIMMIPPELKPITPYLYYFVLNRLFPEEKDLEEQPEEETPNDSETDRLSQITWTTYSGGNEEIVNDPLSHFEEVILAQLLAEYIEKPTVQQGLRERYGLIRLELLYWNKMKDEIKKNNFRFATLIKRSRKNAECEEGFGYWNEAMEKYDHLMTPGIEKKDSESVLKLLKSFLEKSISSSYKQVIQTLLQDLKDVSS